MTALQLKELSHSGLYRRRRDRPDSVGLPGSHEEKLRWVRIDGHRRALLSSLLASFGGFRKQNANMARESHCKTHASRSSPQRTTAKNSEGGIAGAVRWPCGFCRWCDSLPWLWEGQILAGGCFWILSDSQHLQVDNFPQPDNFAHSGLKSVLGHPGTGGCAACQGSWRSPSEGLGVLVSGFLHGGFFVVERTLDKRMQQDHLAWP